MRDVASLPTKMAYGKEDFVFSGFDDYDFSDFSDFSDEYNHKLKLTMVLSESDVDEDVRQYCVCGGPMSKEMIGCDGKHCAVEWWHYKCAGMTAETLPAGDWYCPNCRSTEQERVSNDGEQNAIRNQMAEQNALWTEDKDELLVQMWAVRNYDYYSKVPENIEPRNQSLEEMSSALAMSADDILKRMCSLRNGYRRLVKPLPSGPPAAPTTLRQKWLFSKLWFLAPHVRHRKPKPVVVASAMGGVGVLPKTSKSSVSKKTTSNCPPTHKTLPMDHIYTKKMTNKPKPVVVASAMEGVGVLPKTSNSSVSKKTTSNCPPTDKTLLIDPIQMKKISNKEAAIKYVSRSDYRRALHHMSRTLGGRKAFHSVVRTRLSREFNRARGKMRVTELAKAATLGNMQEFRWGSVLDQVASTMPLTMTVLKGLLPTVSRLESRTSKGSGANRRRMNHREAKDLWNLRAGNTLAMLFHFWFPKIYNFWQSVLGMEMRRQGAPYRLFALFQRIGLCQTVVSARLKVDEICSLHDDASLASWKTAIADVFAETEARTCEEGESKHKKKTSSFVVPQVQQRAPKRDLCARKGASGYGASILAKRSKLSTDAALRQRQRRRRGRGGRTEKSQAARFREVSQLEEALADSGPGRRQPRGKLDLTDPGRLLATLLAPTVTPATFAAEFWERKPLVVHRGRGRMAAGYYGMGFSQENLLRLLTEHRIEFGRDVNVCRYVASQRENLNRAGRATAETIKSLFDVEKATLQFHQPQRFQDDLWHICEVLESHFHSLVGANIYMTPGGSQGLAPHYDDVEVLILQLEGRKHWRLYSPPKQLPRDYSRDLSQHAIGQPTHDFILETGDLLYFPRGTVHQADTPANCPYSVHVTISTYQRSSYGDLLSVALPKMLASAIHHKLDYRRGLPVGYLANTRTEGKSTFENLVGQLSNHVGDHLQEAANQMMCDFIANRLPPYRRSGLDAGPVGPMPKESSRVRLTHPGHMFVASVEDKNEEDSGEDDDEEDEEEDEEDEEGEDEEEVEMDGEEDGVPHADGKGGRKSTSRVTVRHSLTNSRTEHMMGNNQSEPRGLLFPASHHQALLQLKESTGWLACGQLPLPLVDAKSLLVSLWAEGLLEVSKK